MSEPITFTSVTPRYSLPLLFPGQAQKEFYLNEAHSLLDALIHTGVEGVASAPPASPNDGDLWLIATSAQDDWAGMDHHLALYQGNAWRFMAPKPGMRIFDKGLGQFWLYDTQWSSAGFSQEPQGGANIDAEARNAITGLIQVLRSAGILPRS